MAEFKEEATMKPSTEDKAEGKIHEVKGKIKEEIGKVTNDPELGSFGRRGKESRQSSTMDWPC